MTATVRIPLTVLLLVCVYAPVDADAQPVFLQFGETLQPAGPVPDSVKKYLPDEKADATVQYRCEEVAVLWTLMHRGECSPELVSNGTVIRSSDISVTKRIDAVLREVYGTRPPEPEGWDAFGRYAVGAFLLFCFVGPFLRRSAF